MPKKSEPLHKETVTEKAIRLMGQKTVIQYTEYDETCAMYGIPIKIESAKAAKAKHSSLVVYDPFSDRSWYVIISQITEIKASG